VQWVLADLEQWVPAGPAACSIGSVCTGAMRSAGFLKPSRIPLGACAAVRWIDLVLSVVCHACVRWCVVRAWWWPCMKLQVENTDSWRHYFSPDCRRPWRHERGRIATDGPTSLHARSRSSILLCCRSAAAAAEAEAEEELLVSCS
jgi:hypothetical protein